MKTKEKERDQNGLNVQGPKRSWQMTEMREAGRD